MAKTKYFYNSETCKYEKIKVTKRDVLWNTLGLLSASIFLAIGLTLTYNYFFDTKTEAQLKKENREFVVHLASLETSLSDINSLLDELKQRDEKIYKDIYDIDPGVSEINIESNFSDLIDTFYKDGLDNEEAVEEFKKRLNKLNQVTYNDISRSQQLMHKTDDKKLKLEYIPTIQPIDNKDLTALVAGFGNRVNPYHHGVVMHEGIDFAAPRGTAVFATAKGKVSLISTKDTKTGYGLTIEIEHSGLTTKYAHLSEILVKKGKEVEKGDIIGYVGNSGGTIAPCLHYEILRNDVRINPINFMIEGLTENEYLTLLDLSIRKGKSLD